MKNIETGGPAFPCDPTTYTEAKGMTLRDYFAAKALCGIATVTGVNFGTKTNVAKICYELADAMMEARK